MKYNLIIDFLQEKIEKGEIVSGDRMPSIRELCQVFKCANATAVKAYTKLKKRGIVYSVPGSGFYLVENTNLLNENKQNIIDFSETQLDINSLPYEEFQSCLNQAINKYKNNLFSYTDPRGLISLIKVMQNHLQNNQVFTDINNIFITSGSQQAINILCQMPFPGGKNNVVIEQPTYRGIIHSLNLNNVTAIGVNRNFSGLDFKRLENVFRNDNVKLFYTVSRLSNPLGLNYKKEEKKKILSLARKYDVYIVEDDYLGDLDNDSKSDPIFAYDSSQTVIYVKTYSKVLLPGLRIAVVVLPEILINTFREYKYWSDINTPLLSQGALEIYLNSGMFNKHIKKIRNLYLERMNYLKEITAKRETPSIKWYIQPRGGFYASLEILNNNNVEKVVNNMQKKNIIASNIAKYYLKEFYNNKIMRISIANTDINEIKTGIPLLINEIESNKINNIKFINL